MRIVTMVGCSTAVLAQRPPAAEVTHLGGPLGSERRFARIFSEGAPRSGTRVGCYWEGAPGTWTGSRAARLPFQSSSGRLRPYVRTPFCWPLRPSAENHAKNPISSRIPCSPLTVHLPWVLRSTPSKGILSSTNTKTPSFRSEESLRFDNMPIVPTYHH